jgi:hypothetical protein
MLNYNRPCGLVVRDPGFDSRRYQIFWEVMGPKRRPLSLVVTIEELFGRNNSGSGLENREYGRGDPLRWPRDTLYPQKWALTSSTSRGRSVGIVRLRTKATEFVCFVLMQQNTFRALFVHILGCTFQNVAHDVWMVLLAFSLLYALGQFAKELPIHFI